MAARLLYRCREFFAYRDRNFRRLLNEKANDAVVKSNLTELGLQRVSRETVLLSEKSFGIQVI